ncbi:MAG: dTDP-4-dehydrorhamnose 3,5-epimerase [Bacteroidia bacterium]|nr:dTDP-4-dehydrorhamnose 3,5-epimerase [Bacteroidia bacterium]
MKVKKTEFAGLFVIEPSVFTDSRGYFFESYNQRVFEEAGIHASFVQDNQSLSSKGVLRGLHFQKAPHGQGKLVRVLQGAVLDVAVDIRRNSPTFSKYFLTELSEENKKMVYIPEGFAHGFLTLHDHTVFHYKCTGFYNKESEVSLLWNDPAIGINWGIADPVLSEKDRYGLPLSKL